MAEYSLGSAEGTIRIKYDSKGVDQAKSGMDDLESRARKMKGSFQDVAQTTGIAGAAIAGGIALAVNAAIDFEARLDAIGAVSNATVDEMEALRKKALQLGADTAFSAGDAAKAMEELVKAGLSVDDVLSGAADATVALAAAGSIDLPQAATIASNAMNAFGLAASQLPHVADLIAGAANASAIDVNDFGMSLAQAGAVANLVGVKFDDLAAAIALMGNQGIKGSDAGTSLKTMLQNLQPTTQKQIDLFKELGIITADNSNQFFDQQGHIKSLAEVAGVLQGALAGMTDQQKSLALETLFGSDAIRAAAIVANAGADGFNNMAAAMGEVSAQSVAAAKLDNVAGSIEQLKGSVETAAIAFGTALLPVIRKVTDFITLLVNKFSSLDPQWQKLIAFAAVAAAGLLLLISAIAAVGAAIAGVVAAASALEIGAIIAGVVAAVIALAVAFKQAWDNSEGLRTVVATAFNIARDAVTKLAEAMAPVVDFIRNEFIPKFKEMQQALQEKLEPAFRQIAAFLQDKVAPAFSKIKDAIDQAMPTIIEIARWLSEHLFGAFKTVADILAFLVPIILKVAGPVFGALVDVISFLIRNIPTFVHIIGTIIDALKFVGEIIGIAIIGPFVLAYKAGQALFEGLQSLGQTFAGWFASIWSVIGDPIIAAFNLVKSVVETVFTVISALIAAWWTVTQAVFEAIYATIVPPVVATFETIKSAFSTAFDFISGIVKAGWEFISGIFNAVYDFIVPPVQTAFNFIVDLFTAVFEDVKSRVTAGWEAVKTIFQSAVNFITTIVDGIRVIVDKVRDFFGQLRGAAEGGIGPLFEFVQSIPGRILGALGDLFGLLYNKGREIVQGLINGISSMIGAVGSAIGGIVSKVTGFLPGSPAKEGPLSGQGYALYRGQHLAEDLAAGIASSQSDAERAVRNLISGMSGQIPSEIAFNQNLNGSATPTSSGTTYGDININVPLDDLRRITDVQDLLDFIDRLRNNSRRGMAVGV